ncbi:MAG: hypothetical protein IAF38_19625 [Bacteroidia bacterium]|nr:hypothetical protein [Bacteroidia bacterium]
MSKNVTYKLNETNLRGVLSHFEIGFDETHWMETEKNLEALGLQKKTSVTAGAKKIFLFAGLVLLGGGLVAFINLNKKQNNSNFAAGPNQENVIVEGTEYKGLKVLSDLPEIFFTRKAIEAPVAITNDTATAPTLIAENIPTVNVPEKKVEENIVAKKKEEEKIVVEKKVKKEPTEVKETKKKKKKKKRRHQSSGDGTTPVIRSSAGDDDVIIGE